MKTTKYKSKPKMFTKPSLTEQTHKHDCDINTRIKNFIQTGMTMGNTRQPQYGDFSNEIQYQDSLNAVIQANEQFDQLPSQIRRRFQNSPSELLKFISDSNNKDEAIQLGLIEAPEQPLKPIKDTNPTPTIKDDK